MTARAVDDVLYAGFLCASHVGENVTVGGETYLLKSIIHRDDHPTVRLIVAAWRTYAGRHSSLGREQRIFPLDVDPRTVVTMSQRDPLRTSA